MKRSINLPRARRRSAAARGKAASGKFVLRLDPQLHAELRREATRHGLSLNEHCAQVMTVHRAAGDAAAATVIREVRRLAGESLVGVVAYGSWARGEVADSSDVDLLVVLEPVLPITRELYRAWDEQPLTWGGRSVDLHLVHLPEAEAEISGTWAEAATDGIVLFERGLDLSRRLADIRRRIAAGEIVRHVAHGQPYWVRGE
ncbi:MAG: toxin-antitoxin system HicB family antitoxin [Planctomycetia bacterium]